MTASLSAGAVWLIVGAALCHVSGGAPVEAMARDVPTLAQPSVGQVRVVRHEDERLIGIGEVDVVVRTVPEPPSPCAGTRAELQDLVVSGLRDARLKATVSERTSSWYFSVLVSVRGARVEGSCAAAVTTELIAHVEAIPKADSLAPAGRWGSLFVGQLPLLSETALVTAPVGEHAATVQRVVRDQITRVGQRIRAANP